MLKRREIPAYIRKIKGLRAEFGLSQENLAEILGISIATYNRKENGIQEFNRREISQLIETFDLSYEKIFASEEKLSCVS